MISAFGLHRSLWGVAAVLVTTGTGSAQQTPNPEPAAAAATWEELRARPYPRWFQDAKLGVFIHWGVYSVPAYGEAEQYGEWFLRGLQVGDTLRTRFMRENYGEDFEYRDFAPLFRAELFDPDEWADIFRKAGARYVVLVSKHHDGYALWPSSQAPGWNSMDVGPHRDLVGELTESVREAGLRMGLYYSLAEWDNLLHRWYTDPPEDIGPYVEQHMIPQFRELISAYRPEVLFTDGEWFNTAEQWHARELIGWYFDTVGPDAVVNDRWGAGSDIGFLTPEYSAGIDVTDRPWAEVRGLGRSFGLNRNEALDAYMTPAALIHRFVNAVASGGGMILNVGPQADGQIPLLQQERLIQLGEWLAINGEAIYGSSPWVKTGEERDVVLQRVDPNIDFDWVRNTPGDPIKEDNFAAIWTGYIEPRFSETYTFETEADDGIRVWIDGSLVVDGWEVGEPDPDSAATPGGGSVNLVSGHKHTIRVAFHEEDLNAHARLFWSSASQSREVVPQDRLFTTTDRDVGDGLLAEYRSQRRYLAYTRKGGDLFAVTFEWPDRFLELPIAEPLPGTTIHLLGLEGDLPWSYEDGTLFVDFSSVAFRDMPGRWAWTVRLSGYEDAPRMPARVGKRQRAAPENDP